ncbi:hypothetical protein Q7O56_20235 [Pseudomonas protegens]|uniref:hypothetical protein n=1 Tax=Pseudomonas protegens TaxID=380021 RepID=UPI002771D519|nr:hypothetical protein [Pseudomonas protegens]MDP9511370.1 hypothetical protein [Pseudomonas protegens]
MITFLAIFLASLLDPIAVLLGVGLGFGLTSYWKGAAAGATTYLALMLLIPGVTVFPVAVIARLAAGATLGLIGAALGKWIRAGKKSETPPPQI